MSKRTRWAAALAVVALAWGLVPSVHAAADGGTASGTIDLLSTPAKIYPANTSAGLWIGPGQEVPLPANAYVNVRALKTTYSYGVFAGPCGTASTTAVVHDPLGATRSNDAVTGAADCLTSNAIVAVVVHQLGSVSAPHAGGLRYVPMPDTPLIVDPTGNGKQLGSGGMPSNLISDLTALVPPGARGVMVDMSMHPVPVGWVYDVTASIAVGGECKDGLAHTGPHNGDVQGRSIVAFKSDYSGAVRRSVCTMATVSGYGGYGVVAVRVLGYFTDALATGDDLPPITTYEALDAPGLVPLDPVRVLDTRQGLGAAARKVEANEIVRLDLFDRTSWASTAVALNVTATDSEGWGYVTVFPCGEAPPNVSNVNTDVGKTVANHVVVGLASDGAVCLVASERMHLLADLAGSFDFDAAGRFTALEPNRIFDSRAGDAVRPGAPVRVQVAGVNGVPSDATAASFTLTVVDPQGWGYASAFPCDAAEPTVSNVNYTTGKTVANLVTVKLSADGSVCLSSYTAAHLLVDLAGSYSASGTAGFHGYWPERWIDTRLSAEPLPAGTVGAVSFEEAADLRPVSVVANLTVTETRGAGFLSAFPCGADGSATSNVNFSRGDTVAAAGLVRLSSELEVCLSASNMSHVIVDVAGFMATEPYWIENGS